MDMKNVTPEADALRNARADKEMQFYSQLLPLMNKLANLRGKSDMDGLTQDERKELYIATPRDMPSAPDLTFEGVPREPMLCHVALCDVEAGMNTGESFIKSAKDGEITIAEKKAASGGGDGGDSEKEAPTTTFTFNGSVFNGTGSALGDKALPVTDMNAKASALGAAAAADVKQGVNNVFFIYGPMVAAKRSFALAYVNSLVGASNGPLELSGWILDNSETMHDALEPDDSAFAAPVKPRLTKDGYTLRRSKGDPIVQSLDEFAPLRDRAFARKNQTNHLGLTFVNPESKTRATVVLLSSSVKLAGAHRGAALIERQEARDGGVPEGDECRPVALGALSHVLARLGDDMRPSFRESKITLMLQASLVSIVGLGSRGRISGLFTVAPSAADPSEHLDVLRWMDRLRGENGSFPSTYVQAPRRGMADVLKLQLAWLDEHLPKQIKRYEEAIAEAEKTPHPDYAKLVAAREKREQLEGALEEMFEKHRVAVGELYLKLEALDKDWAASGLSSQLSSQMAEEPEGLEEKLEWQKKMNESEIAQLQAKIEELEKQQKKSEQ